MTNHPHLMTGCFAAHQERFADQCTEMSKRFDESTQVIRSGRNTLKKIDWQGSECVIKSFKIPTFPQNFAYGLFSPSKAQKSFENGNKLIRLGFLSPRPIGYFETRSGGKLRQSYYACEFAAGSQTLYQKVQVDHEFDEHLQKSFARYCLALHQKGILHRDFNPKNILIWLNNGEWQFSLVDINRITWMREIPLSKAMESMSRLTFSPEDKAQVLKHYAAFAGLDYDHCLRLLLRSVAKTQRYFRNKKRLRKIFPRK